MALSYERRHLSLAGFHKNPGGAENLVGVARNIEVNTAITNSAGAGASPLHSFSLPADSLRNDDDYLLVWYGGNFAANDNDKIVNGLFGGTAYITGGPVDLDGAIGWSGIIRIVRLSATSVRTNHIFVANSLFADSANVVNTFAAGGFIVSRSNDIIGLPNLNNNAITMLVQGIGVANADVIQNLSIIELVQN